jgi:hypothetical protein
MRTICLLILIGLCAGGAASQNLSADLQDPARKLHDAFDQNLKQKGWERKSIEPLLNSPDVIVDNWKFFDRGVKVSIVLLPADPEARRKFRSPHPNSTRIEALGDEAYVEGYCGSTVYVYRGRLSISVSTGMDLKLLSPNKQETESLRCAEATATSKLIACFVNAALIGEFSKDKPFPRDRFFRAPCEQELVRRGLVGEYVLNRVKNSW